LFSWLSLVWFLNLSVSPLKTAPVQLLIPLHIELETQQMLETSFIVDDQDTGSIPGFLGQASLYLPFI